MDEEVVKEHKSIRQLTKVAITPNHSKRTESSEFIKNKKRLKEDGYFKCWICGSEEKLQVHHLGCQ